MKHQVLPRPVDRERPKTHHVMTFFSGSLWEGDNRELPTAVALHEASHYTTFHQLRHWLEVNLQKDEGNRDAAFIRHAVLDVDGQYKIDFGFATLFMELSACFATGVYFDTLLNLSAASEDLKWRLSSIIAMGMKYMTNPIYRPYLEQAGIDIPDFTDPRVVFSEVPQIIRRFVKLVTG